LIIIIIIKLRARNKW